MRAETGYLSDEELEQLILEVEQNELVAAPPDLGARILLRSELPQEDIDDAYIFPNTLESLQRENTSKDKVTEFYRYCFRVITSAAAAIAIIFGLPHMEVKPQAEVLSRQELQGRILTREEVLKDERIFFRIFNEADDFDSKDK